MEGEAQPEGTREYLKECSPSAVRLLKSAEKLAKKLGYSDLLVRHITLTLPKQSTTQKILKEVNLDPKNIQRILWSKESRLTIRSPVELSFSTNTKLPKSTQDVLKNAYLEKGKAGAPKIRAGDIMIAILQLASEQIPAGKVLEEALSSPGWEIGDRFLNQLRDAINKIEPPTVRGAETLN